MNFKASFYMALNKTGRFAEPCSDDELDVEVYWHDCKGKWIFESLYVLIRVGGHKNRHLPSNWVFHCSLCQPALSVCGGWGGTRSVAQLWPLWAHFSDRHLSLCGGLCAVIDYWPPQQSHHSTLLRYPTQPPLSPHRDQRATAWGARVMMNEKLIL